MKNRVCMQLMVLCISETERYFKRACRGCSYGLTKELDLCDLTKLF